ncbi:MAG: T9SS type A sorting domain-containing protein [Saprospiraceae bacterium]
MSKILFTILTAVVLPLTIFAQLRGTCATDQEALIPRLEENKIAAEHLVDTRMDNFVPITWHRIGRTDGTGKVTYLRILEQMCRLNDDYSDVGLVFYIKRINDINSSSIYENHRVAVNGVLRNEQDNGSINIFVPNNANINEDDLGVTLGYYDPSPDWLVMRRVEVDGITSTLSHEIGHFFSLPHPHRGWDIAPFDDSGNENAPTFSPGGQLTELVDGSNCDNAGDRICDTPPDYNLGFGWPNCDYTGNAKDPNGEELDPQEINFMGYFLNCSRDDYIFTPMQTDMMKADYQRADRAYIRTNFSPSTADVGKATNISPTPDETTASFDEIRFEWEGAENAEMYLLEVDRLPTFALNPVRVLFENGETSYTLREELQADKKYYWRVTSFSRGDYCTQRGNSSSFVTGVVSDVAQIETVADFSVYPNPARNGQEIVIDVETTERFAADILLTDLNGRTLQRISNRMITLGSNQIRVATDQLPAGVYNVTVASEGGIKNQRVVILD